jgi:transcriptional regulator with XRE-family HTH domain
VDHTMTPGQRIASYRRRRGLTQAAAAGLVGVTLSCWQKWEHAGEPGGRMPRTLATWFRVAQVLDVGNLYDLTGLPTGSLPDDPPENPLAAAIRQAMLIPSATSDDEAPDLTATLQRVWDMWQTAPFNHDQVGVHLPAVITQVQHAQRVTPTPALADTATRLWLLVREWGRGCGAHDVMLMAADRATHSAANTNSPAAQAAAAWATAAALSTRGLTGESAAAAEVGIAAVKPYVADGGDPLVMLGALHIMASVEYGRMGDQFHAYRSLEAGADIASKVGDGNVYRTVFGPTNVAIYRATIAHEAGQTGEAIRIAERVDVATLPSVERRFALLAVLGEAYAQRRQDVAAVTMYAKAYQEYPQGCKANPMFRENVRELLHRETPAIRDQVRPLAASLSLI